MVILCAESAPDHFERLECHVITKLGFKIDGGAADYYRSRLLAREHEIFNVKQMKPLSRDDFVSAMA